jgi:D-alanyl-D-alanine carboxypeptidase (penicillin-binding protein 5/6)
MKKLLIMLFVFFIGITLVKADDDLAPNAKSAILIEASTGKVLFEKNADEGLPPASMTKIMSMLLIMESIDNGTLSLNDEVVISKEASDMGGSQVFLNEGETYKVSELLKGIAIASGNDAVVAMAEKVAGSTSSFVQMMNDKAQELGLQNTTFINPHGLDAEGHKSSARDMSIIARELLKHEKILEFSSIYEEYLTKNDGTKTWLVNTNKLVRFYNGADGLKTGFTQSAGYCLTATAKRNNLRLISVVMGEDTSDLRSADTVKMLNFGFNTYKANLIMEKDKVIGKVRIIQGKKEDADVVLKEDAIELLNVKDKKSNYSFNILVDKVKAPIKKGDVIGKSDVIDDEGNVIDSVDITINEDIKKANFFDYLKRNINIVTGGRKILKNS